MFFGTILIGPYGTGGEKEKSERYDKGQRSEHALVVIQYAQE